MTDAHTNFAYSTVLTAPSPASSGTSLVVQSGDGAKYPAVPFNVTIWPVNSLPTTGNAEIARVTARSTDTLTITRAQEGSSARAVVVGDQIAATITAKTLTDVEKAIVCQAYQTGTSQTVTNNATDVALTWDTTLIDTDPTMHNTSSNKNRITINTAGYYMFFGSLYLTANGAGTRYLKIRDKVATLRISMQYDAITGLDAVVNVGPVPILCAAADWFDLSLQVSASATGAQTVLNGVANSTFMAWRIGSA